MVRTRTRGQTQTVWMLFCRSMGPDLAIKHSVFPLPDFPYPIWYLRKIRELCTLNLYIYIYPYIYIFIYIYNIHISYRYTLLMNIWVMYKFRSTPSRCIRIIPVHFPLACPPWHGPKRVDRGWWKADSPGSREIPSGYLPSGNLT